MDSYERKKKEKKPLTIRIDDWQIAISKEEADALHSDSLEHVVYPGVVGYANLRKRYPSLLFGSLSNRLKKYSPDVIHTLHCVVSSSLDIFILPWQMGLQLSELHSKTS